jgi:hypothetical protein
MKKGEMGDRSWEMGGRRLLLLLLILILILIPLWSR